MGGTVSTEKKTARWGSNVIAPVPVRAGYAFAGWYVDRACTEAFDGTMPAYDITLYMQSGMQIRLIILLNILLKSLMVHMNCMTDRPLHLILTAR